MRADPDRAQPAVGQVGPCGDRLAGAAQAEGVAAVGVDVEFCRDLGGL